MTSAARLKFGCVNIEISKNHRKEINLQLDLFQVKMPAKVIKATSQVNQL